MTEARPTDNVFLYIQPNFQLGCLPLAKKLPKLSRHSLYNHIQIHRNRAHSKILRKYVPLFIIYFMTAAFFTVKLCPNSTNILLPFFFDQIREAFLLSYRFFPFSMLLDFSFSIFIFFYSLFLHPFYLSLPSTQYARSLIQWGHEGICVPWPVWASVRLV